jgi:hypothetical protein
MATTSHPSTRKSDAAPKTASATAPAPKATPKAPEPEPVERSGQVQVTGDQRTRYEREPEGKKLAGADPSEVLSQPIDVRMSALYEEHRRMGTRP